ncbi:DUF2252 family protein [Burkholderia sp. BCC0322]|uniref:DUF2252 family protein n=1 Tax=Burkholderia sp. LMG 21824 TaxID=3158172 RepID=UPI00158AFE75
MRRPTPVNGRQGALVALRSVKMARSARAYVRGNTVRFHAWLESLERRTLPENPPVRIGGNCHAGNPCPVANAQGHVDSRRSRAPPARFVTCFFARGSVQWFSGDVLRTARATR